MTSLMPSPSPRRSRGARPAHSAVVACILVGSLLSVVAGCSIQTDSRPRALPIRTTTTSTPTVTATVGGSEADLFYVLDGQLVPVSVSLSDHRLSTVLAALFDQPDESVEQSKLTTSIPVGTRITDTRLQDGTLTLDLSRDFENVVGPARQQALGQIVLTASEFPEVSRIRLQIDGDPVQVATPTRGDVSTVTDCDYRTLLPTASDLRTAELPADTVDRLESRAEALAERCPTKP